jgi:LacI family transcriptional regulator
MGISGEFSARLIQALTLLKKLVANALMAKSTPQDSKNKYPKRVRMKDIADSLSINLSTVSRALNPETSAKISPTVVKRVQQAARKLGYIGNAAASGLRRQKSFTIGVVVPDILNPIFPPIIKGAQQLLSEKGYITFIVYSDNNRDIARDEIRKLIARQVDGLILASAFLEDSSVQYAVEQGTPLVLVNRTVLRPQGFHQVLSNDALGITLAMEHLYELGHRKIMHLAGPQDVLQGVVRLESFIDCCKSMGIGHEVIQLDSFSLDAGRKGAQQMIQQGLDCSAILAGNDLIACGAIKALTSQGIKIPTDLSVVGFNDMPFADMLNPPLTTVSIPLKYLGVQSARLLLEEMASPGGPKSKVLLDPTLVVRDTTAPCRYTRETQPLSRLNPHQTIIG